MAQNVELWRHTDIRHIGFTHLEASFQPLQRKLLLSGAEIEYRQARGRNNGIARQQVLSRGFPKLLVAALSICT